jgi:hypothetical protein
MLLDAMAGPLAGMIWTWTPSHGPVRTAALHYGASSTTARSIRSRSRKRRGRAGGVASAGTRAKPVEGGWIVNGKKIACFRACADYYGVRTDRRRRKASR